MRNPWQSGSSPRRGRRGSGLSSATPSSSPYDFAHEREDETDPVDLLAIRADDELLDALASGRPGGGHLPSVADHRLDAGYNDEQQMLTLLQAMREDVDSEPFPDLMSVEEASAAIVAGRRASAPKRRLMPVATAAAVAVLAMSGVAIGAGGAEPGDPLWGVSTVLNGNRAKSVEAAYRVTAALSQAQQALAEGRTADAKAVLAGVQGDLSQVRDQERKDELSRKSANLAEAVEETPEGEKVETDEHGSRKDKDKSGQGGQLPADPKASQSAGPGPDPSIFGVQPGQPGSQRPDPGQGQQGQNPGGQQGGGQESQRPAPQSQKPTPQSQKPPPPQQSNKPPESAKPEPRPAPQTTKPANEKPPPQTTKPANENPKPPPETKKPKPTSGGGGDSEERPHTAEKEKDKPKGGGQIEGQADPHPAGEEPAVLAPTTPQGVGIPQAQPIV